MIFSRQFSFFFFFLVDNATFLLTFAVEGLLVGAKSNKMGFEDPRVISRCCCGDTSTGSCSGHFGRCGVDDGK